MGEKSPTNHGLFTNKGVEWLHGLNLDPIEYCLRVLKPLNEEIKLLSKELQRIAEDDDDVKLLMTISGIGYYSAILMKSKIGAHALRGKGLFGAKI